MRLGIREQRKLDKEQELNLKKEKMMLEDALQEAEILAEKISFTKKKKQS